jgi:hypothetical protein
MPDAIDEIAVLDRSQAALAEVRSMVRATDQIIEKSILLMGASRASMKPQAPKVRPVSVGVLYPSEPLT